MAPALTYPLPNVRKKRGVRWKSTEDLVQSPRRRLQHASGTIVKSTGLIIYLGFFDTETNREEIAVYTIDNEIDDRENIPVLFDAYQMDPRYPVYCDDVFVTWIVTKLEFKIINSSDKVVTKAKGDPFKLSSRYENKYLLSFYMVPTFYTGSMEFYGYFKHWEDEFNRFKQNLHISCSFRSTKPQQLVENEIYAMPILPILMMENEKSSQDFEICNWTRVRCKKIINPKFIQGDLFETGETSKKVAIKNLIMIPDYIASQPRFIFRFILAGCRDITLEDLNGDLAKYMDTLTKSEEFFKSYFEENKNTIKCYSGFSKDGRILIYAENRAKENLTLHVIGRNLAKMDPDTIPDEMLDDFLQE